MSRQGTAWSVKGVDQATRDIARRASQAAGMTIGEWIDQAIRADAEARGDPPTEVGSDVPAAPAPGPARTSPGLPPTVVGRVSLNTVDALAARLDAADARLDSAMRPIAYALQDIAERLVALERPAGELPPSPEDRRESTSPVADNRASEPSEFHSPARDRPAQGPADPGRPPSVEPIPPMPEPAIRAISAADAPEPRGRPLPTAPPPNWEPVVRIRQAELAALAESMRAPLEPAELLQAEQDPDGPSRAAATGAGDVTDPDGGPGRHRQPADRLAEARPDPVLDVESDAIRFEEPEPALELEAEPGEAEPGAETAAVVSTPAPTRPDPVPPTGDLPVDAAFRGPVPDWLTRTPPQPAVPEPEEGFAPVSEPTPDPAGEITAGPDREPDADPAASATAPEVAPHADDIPRPVAPSAADDIVIWRPRPVAPARATGRIGPWLRLAAATLLLLAATGGWWLATGGGIPSPDRVRDRLAQSAGDVQAAAEAGWRTARAEFDRLAAELSPAEPVPEEPRRAGPAPSATVPAAPSPATPAPPPLRRPSGQVAEAPIQPVPTPLPTAVAPEPSSSQSPLADPVPTPAVPTPPVSAPPVSAPPVLAEPSLEAAAPVPAAPTAPVAAGPVPTTPATPALQSAPDRPRAEVPSAPPAVQPAAPPPAPPLPRSSEPTDAGQTVAAAPATTAPDEPDNATLLAQARAGDPRAQYTLAIRLLAAAVPDHPQAANWLRESAIQGVPNAQYNLGVLYERGLGVPQDDTRALLWYHSAAEQGHALAQYNLGVLYSAGRGIPLSYAEAARWFGRAAEQGVPAAVYNLSVLSEGGLGVQRDPAEAERLLRRAAELGHPKARQRLRAGGITADAATLEETAETVAEVVVAEDVVTIQRRLTQLGLYDGPVDGVVGPRTREAIARYQQREGLPVTGLPSTALRRRLSPTETSG